MIGFYDYTVVVTYISLISSIMGMFFCNRWEIAAGSVLPCIFRIM